MNDAVVVVDASVLVDVLLVPTRSEQLARLVGDRVVAAPAHVDAEVVSALARLYRHGDLSADQVVARLALVEAMTLHRHLLAPLLEQAWRLRDNVAVLDALYVALAQALGTTVLTTDGRLSRANEHAKLVHWTDPQ
ncbi:type II toxin-antitoxin system VapC family toxin [Candidatus Nanopelagicales bacterium]|nr:type II toxin-antitoxin system VapC family toxin [Candidatus Nanopelagicales bacterium]